MAGLPLHRLPPAHLEKIIRKVEPTSYFRLQQTCQDMKELVQINRRVKMTWNRGPFLFTSRNEDGSLDCVLVFDGHRKSANISSLYGIRFDYLSFPIGLEDPKVLKDYCDTMKKYRITAKDADFYSLKEFSPEQYILLFKTLRPVKAELVGRGVDRLEMLLQVKELEGVSATMDLAEVFKKDLLVLKQFLVQFQVLRFLVNNREMTPYFAFFEKILQFLKSEPLPKLRNFELTGTYEETVPLPSADELLNLFQAFNPIILKQLCNEETGETNHYNLKCELGENGFCEVRIEWQCMEIEFKQGEEHLNKQLGSVDVE